jgi:hypothetical protein
MGTGQTVQAPVPARFVVGFSDDVPAYLLRQVDFLDTGNGVGLGLAITAANAVVASAQNPGCEVLILDGTIDLDAAGAPTTPYSLSNGVVLRGSGIGATNSPGCGTQIVGRSAVGADQGIITVGGTGARCGLKSLEFNVREPTGATAGSTNAINMGSSTTSYIEDCTVNFVGTLNSTEAGNLTLRFGLATAGGLNRVLLLGGGWKIRQFIAADFVGINAAGGGSGLGVVSSTRTFGFDIGMAATGFRLFRDSSFDSCYSHAVTSTGSTTGRLTFVACTFFPGQPSGVDADGFRLDPAAGATLGPQFIGCTFANLGGTGTQRGIALLSTSSRSILDTQIIGCQFSTLDTGIDLGANVTSTVIVGPSFAAVTTAIIDAGINTTGSKQGMTWRGTFIAGAGATTAYAGMGEANAEMLAANAQKRFPANPGVAFRLRVQVISNSMPANTVFTVMLDTGATALTVTVGAAATGQFVDTDSVVFAAAAANSFTTWDLRVVETGVGTIVFSATLELI